MMSLSWEKGSPGYFPQNAVIGGHESPSGEQIYIVRANHASDVLSGKGLRSHTSAYVSHGGKEVPVRQYEILVAGNPYHQPTWQPSSGGQVPRNAVQGGYTAGNDPLYIARARAPNESMCPGKLHPSHRVCYIPWGGKEHSQGSYEVLVLN